MNNATFWESVNTIINEGFTPEGLQKLDHYAELFISERIIYKRFSQIEQHGCSKGGTTNVIATLLSGAKISSNNSNEIICDFKRECQQAAEQAECIEKWAKATNCWIDNLDIVLTNTLGELIAEGGEAQVYDHGATLIKSIGLEYFIQPILALDRISLHNAYFPETGLTVLGFGRNGDGDFKIIVEQPFIKGEQMSDKEIKTYMQNMGFELKNPRNWTYATPDIYLSDIHDENIIRSISGNIFVIDCDIRINIPELKADGIRHLTTEVEVKY